MVLVRAMSVTRCTETQHRLLHLITTLLGASNEGIIDGFDIPGNAEQLLNVESISQFCQLVAWCHTNPRQVGNMLSEIVSQSKVSFPRIANVGSLPNESKPSKCNSGWVYSTGPAVWYVAPPQRLPPLSETIRGPFRVADLVAMLENEEIHQHSLVTAAHVDDYSGEDGSGANGKESQIDTGKWQDIDKIWQLRWQLCANQNSLGVYGPADVSSMALSSLSRLVSLHRSVDYRGIPFTPIPVAKRLLTEQSRDPTRSEIAMGGSLGEYKSAVNLGTETFLPIICQALLSDDTRVAEQAVILLQQLMSHNDEACSKLYLTGVFFFILCHPGSNFLPMASLLQETHLRQHFRSGFAAIAKESDLSVKDRSILGNMLPEGLLLILTKYGAKNFCDAFLGNVDTPEGKLYALIQSKNCAFISLVFFL